MKTKKSKVLFVKKSDLGNITYFGNEKGQITGATNKKKAKCHPNRPHYCKGLCRNCYEKQLRNQNFEYAERQRESSRNWDKKNPEKKKESDRIWIEKNPEKKKRTQLKYRLKKYGITPKEYQNIFKRQNGKCALCKKFPDKHKCLMVDHNHSTGKVRGLLCKSCNFLVGTFEKRMALLMEAGRYLQSFETGGAKYDSNKLLFSAFPPRSLQEVAKVFTVGANKYGVDNWRDGLLWGRVFSAMQRHAWAWWGGEEFDQEDEQHHLASVAWCALILFEYIKSHPELDDRIYNLKKKLG